MIDVIKPVDPLVGIADDIAAIRKYVKSFHFWYVTVGKFVVFLFIVFVVVFALSAAVGNVLSTYLPPRR